MSVVSIVRVFVCNELWVKVPVAILFSTVTSYKYFWGFRVLRIVGKGTSRHLVQYSHFVQVFSGFSCAKNYG